MRMGTKIMHVAFYNTTKHHVMYVKKTCGKKQIHLFLGHFFSHVCFFTTPYTYQRLKTTWNRVQQGTPLPVVSFCHPKKYFMFFYADGFSFRKVAHGYGLNHLPLPFRRLASKNIKKGAMSSFFTLNQPMHKLSNALRIFNMFCCLFRWLPGDVLPLVALLTCIDQGATPDEVRLKVTFRKRRTGETAASATRNPGETSPVEGKVVEIPWFTRFFSTVPNGGFFSGVSEPEKPHVFYKNEDWWYVYMFGYVQICSDNGGFLKWWYHPKMIIFSRKTHGVVGETHHLRKPPYMFMNQLSDESLDLDTETKIRGA